MRAEGRRAFGAFLGGDERERFVGHTRAGEPQGEGGAAAEGGAVKNRAQLPVNIRRRLRARRGKRGGGGQQCGVIGREILHRGGAPARARLGVGRRRSQTQRERLVFERRRGQRVHESGDLLAGEQGLRIWRAGTREFRAVTPDEQAREGKLEVGVAGGFDGPSRLGDGAVEVALPELAQHARVRRRRRVPGRLEVVRRFLGLLVGAVARGRLGARLKVRGREGRLFREVLEIFERGGEPERRLDVRRGAQDVGIIRPQPAGRADLQPRHAVVAGRAVRRRLGCEVARAPAGEDVVSARGGEARDNDCDRACGQGSLQSPPASAGEIFHSGRRAWRRPECMAGGGGINTRRCSTGMLILSV